MPDWSVFLCYFLILLGIMRAIIWFNNRIVGPRWQQNLSKKESFSELIRLGFHTPEMVISHYSKTKPTEAVVFVGRVSGYTVEISFNYLTGWTISPYYTVRVFFSTGTLTPDELLIRRENNLAQSRFYRWNEAIKLTSNHVEQISTVGKYTKPSGKSLLAIAKHLTDELQKLDLHPVGYEEGVNQWKINQD